MGHNIAENKQHSSLGSDTGVHYSLYSDIIAIALPPFACADSEAGQLRNVAMNNV